jgi:hypothetical protein
MIRYHCHDAVMDSMTLMMNTKVEYEHEHEHKHEDEDKVTTMVLHRDIASGGYLCFAWHMCQVLIHTI